MSGRPLLTVRDVTGVTFDDAGLLQRGYDQGQVDDFLDVVAGTIETLTATIEQQGKEIDRIRHWRHDHGTTQQSQDAVGIIDQIIHNARQRATQIREEAQENARRVEAAAYNRAQRVIADAGIVAERVPYRPADVHSPVEFVNTVADIEHRISVLRDALSIEVDKLQRLVAAYS